MGIQLIEVLTSPFPHPRDNSSLGVSCGNSTPNAFPGRSSVTRNWMLLNSSARVYISLRKPGNFFYSERDRNVLRRKQEYLLCSGGQDPEHPPSSKENASINIEVTDFTVHRSHTGEPLSGQTRIPRPQALLCGRGARCSVRCGLHARAKRALPCGAGPPREGKAHAATWGGVSP